MAAVVPNSGSAEAGPSSDGGDGWSEVERKCGRDGPAQYVLNLRADAADRSAAGVAHEKAGLGRHRGEGPLGEKQAAARLVLRGEDAAAALRRRAEGEVLGLHSLDEGVTIFKFTGYSQRFPRLWRRTPCLVPMSGEWASYCILLL